MKLEQFHKNKTYKIIMNSKTFNKKMYKIISYLHKGNKITNIQQ